MGRLYSSASRVAVPGRSTPHRKQPAPHGSDHLSSVSGRSRPTKHVLNCARRSGLEQGKQTEYGGARCATTLAARNNLPRRAPHRHDRPGIRRPPADHWPVQRLTSRRASVRLLRNGIGQRMTDKPHRHLMLLVDFALQRGNRSASGRYFANFQHALLPPGPHGWADVMHGFDSGRRSLSSSVEVEIRRIDADKHIRLCDQGHDQTFAARQQLNAGPSAHLDQPHHRQALHREIGIQPWGLASAGHRHR